MAGQVERRDLAAERFLARRSDLFIWHALLLHGGSAIESPELTPQSLVTHHWTRADRRTRRLDLQTADGGWWVNRTPQPVP